MIRMITKTPHEYAGRKLNDGDEFDCEDPHVALLLALGRADLVETGPALNGAAIAPALARAASQRAILKRSVR